MEKQPPQSTPPQRKQKRSAPRSQPITIPFMVRLYPDERELIETAAKLERLTMSSYIARAAYRRAKVDLAQNGYDPDQLLIEAKIAPTIRKP